MDKKSLKNIFKKKFDKRDWTDRVRIGKKEYCKIENLQDSVLLEDVHLSKAIEIGLVQYASDKGEKKDLFQGLTDDQRDSMWSTIDTLLQNRTIDFLKLDPKVCDFLLDRAKKEKLLEKQSHYYGLKKLRDWKEKKEAWKLKWK